MVDASPSSRRITERDASIVARLRDARLDFIARLVLFQQAGADFLHLPLEFRRCAARRARSVLCQAAFEIAGFLLGARHALLDARGFANLRFEAAFGALGLHVHLRELRRASVSCASSA
jgi:hypothetical protein